MGHHKRWKCQCLHIVIKSYSCWLIGLLSLLYALDMSWAKNNTIMATVSEKGHLAPKTHQSSPVRSSCDVSGGKTMENNVQVYQACTVLAFNLKWSSVCRHKQIYLWIISYQWTMYWLPLLTHWHLIILNLKIQVCKGLVSIQCPDNTLICNMCLFIVQRKQAFFKYVNKIWIKKMR